jgi:ubiquinone/menaquinone biosynthesis C-methylase UbiE
MKYGFSKKLNTDYDLIIKAWPYEKEMHVRTAQEIKKSGAKTLIEFGCGSGEATKYISKYNPNLKILATDIDTVVITNARTNISSKNVTFKTFDAFKFKSKTEFDAVSSSHFIHNFKHKDQLKLLKMMYSILNSGGFFITYEKILPDDSTLREKLWERQINRFKLYDKYRRADLKIKMLEHEAADKSTDSILIESPFRKMLEKIGFKDVKIVLRRDRDVVLTARK